MKMPNMDGGKLIREARLINPQIVTVVFSGDVAEGASVGAELSLRKPYSLAALLHTLDQAIALHKRVTTSR
jgi:CheY-like chemotaxis protein